MANLRVLSDEAAGKDDQLRALIDGSSGTFAALAQEEGSLDSSLGRLPGTLASARRALVESGALATELRPALGDLRPTVQALAPTLKEVRPLLREGEPILRQRIRPLVREARPVVQDLAPTLRDQRALTPKLDSAFDVLNYVVNEMAYNPDGPEEGYGFWAPWFFHNSNSILSTEDAQGAAWRGQLMVSCSTIAELSKVQPLLAIVAAIPACPADGSKTVVP
jgi:phospholipid/cholesterol/gamma-HCH transport system substrate-binding protein